MPDYTSDEVRQLLWQHIKATPTAPLTQKALADKIGVSTPFLNDILQKKREPSGKVLEFLKLERIVTYRFREKRR